MAEEKEEKRAKKEAENPMVAIAAVIGGISVAIVALFVIFAKEQLEHAPLVIGALAVMGIFMGLFSLRKK
jgi:uncharacterized membrane protein